MKQPTMEPEVYIRPCQEQNSKHACRHPAETQPQYQHKRKRRKCYDFTKSGHLDAILGVGVQHASQRFIVGKKIGHEGRNAQTNEHEEKNLGHKVFGNRPFALQRCTIDNCVPRKIFTILIVTHKLKLITQS